MLGHLDEKFKLMLINEIKAQNQLNGNFLSKKHAAN